MENSYKFFQNKDCQYFPCHKVALSNNLIDKFNCLMCFCPLYFNRHCGGNYTIMENGVKDCSECVLPHFNYDYIMSKLTPDYLTLEDK